jgi:hypothetical protein
VVVAAVVDGVLLTECQGTALGLQAAVQQVQQKAALGQQIQAVAAQEEISLQAKFGIQAALLVVV